MSKPVPTPTETEIVGEVQVVRAGKVIPADLRAITQDTVALVAQKFGGEKLLALFEELAKAECITNGGRRIPDNRTRLAIATYLGNHILGTPVQRTESVSVNLDADSAVGMRERLQNSPALRQVFRRVLDEIDGGEGQTGV